MEMFRVPHGRRIVFVLVTDEELANIMFLRDVKAFARKLKIPRRRFVDWLVDSIMNVHVLLVDENGNAVEYDFEAIERDHIDLWFRDWIKLQDDHVHLRVRAESRERIRLVATLLRMIFPKEATVWGKPILLLTDQSGHDTD